MIMQHKMNKPFTIQSQRSRRRNLLETQRTCPRHASNVRQARSICQMTPSNRLLQVTHRPGGGGKDTSFDMSTNFSTAGGNWRQPRMRSSDAILRRYRSTRDNQAERLLTGTRRQPTFVGKVFLRVSSPIQHNLTGHSDFTNASSHPRFISTNPHPARWPSGPPSFCLRRKSWACLRTTQAHEPK